MTKCEYCGKEIDVFEHRSYIWLDKETNNAIHETCLEKYKKEHPENMNQTAKERQIQKDPVTPIEKMIPTKILGLVLLLFTTFWTFLAIYDYITFLSDLISVYIPLFVFSILVVIALITIRKKGIYHKFIVLSGMILLTFYLIALVAGTLL